MSARARRLFARLLVGGVVAAVIAPLGAAWACVPMANVVSLEPRSAGPQGSRVEVNGLGFADVPVEIRWNAPDGRRLGTARGPDFSVKVTIPEGPSGLYTLIAVERQEDGSIGNAGSAPFDVTAEDQDRGGATAPAAGLGTESRSSQAASGPRWLVLATAGIALVALGALGAALLTRRRAL